MNNTRKSLVLFGLGAAVGYIANLGVERKDQIKATVKGVCDRVAKSLDICAMKFKGEDAVENVDEDVKLDYDFSLVPMTFETQASAYTSMCDIVQAIKDEGYVTFAEFMLERSVSERIPYPESDDIPQEWREFGWTDAELFVPYKTATGEWKITDVLPHRLYKVEKETQQNND